MNKSANLRIVLFCFAFSVSLNLFLLKSHEQENRNGTKNADREVAQVVRKPEDLEIHVPPLSAEIMDYHRRLNLTNPGHLGLPVILPKDIPGDIQMEINKSVSEFKFNEFVSRLIPLDRELPDYRKGTCINATYLPNLPKVSVILAIYNEPFTMVMRTVFSILKRSPAELIEEIVLVDDCSDKESLLKPLHEILPKLPKVWLIKSPSRLGLMKARMLGAANAKGPILVVMDAHMEVTTGWLPPLIDPIVRNPRTITQPGVETIKPDTLMYNDVIFDKYNYVGGLTWELRYTWIKVPKANRSETPLRAPTMLGAAFVIRKDYFEYLGYYDSGYELWGAENLELSFKVWMCGGEMYQVFCSHVGHMYRERPYWDATSDAKKIRNTDRLAEVWMDDWKKYYHKATKFDNRDFGNVADQRNLREKLGCKSFQWYVDNVYPSLKGF